MKAWEKVEGNTFVLKKDPIELNGLKNPFFNDCLPSSL